LLNKLKEKGGAKRAMEVFEQNVHIAPIGIIHSCFTEKFGIPRQPGMVASATARLELFTPFNREEMVRGLEQFSHIWIHFRFHQTVEEGWKSTVRPPWLGGRKRVGIFASRSPHRPNYMGLSVVRLDSVVREKGKSYLELSGIDFLDNTPVFDIKPYVPYSDSIPSASCGYARGEKPVVKVAFSEKAEVFCAEYQGKRGRNIRQLIEDMIRNDPRPASQKNGKDNFGMSLWNVNIRWKVQQECFYIESCEELSD
jgi:tRNA-Thr(GGU) m(6)t(6)A37 methyltransferase TsaA